MLTIELHGIQLALKSIFDDVIRGNKEARVDFFKKPSTHILTYFHFRYNFFFNFYNTRRGADGGFTRTCATYFYLFYKLTNVYVYNINHYIKNYVYKVNWLVAGRVRT